MSSTKVNRNDPCPCGSGKKFKKCCMGAASAAAPSPGAAADAKPFLAEAIAHHRAERLAPAIQGYRRVLEIDPVQRDALFQLGRLMGQIGQPAEGVELLTRAIAVDGKQAIFHGHLAAQLVEIGRGEAAVRAARRAMELEPRNAWVHCAAAGCYERLNRMDEAIQAARSALRIDPDDAQAALILAGLERRTGRLAEARQRLDAVLARDELDDALRQRALVHLGNVLDRLGEYPAAFEAFRRVGVLTEKSPLARELDTARWSRRIRAYREGLTPELIRGPRGAGARDGRPAPAFLLGFPRSGTTMTEQILAAHPNVVTSDEQQLVTAVRNELARRSGDAGPVEALATLDHEGIAALRETYWSEVEANLDAPLDGRVFVDKLPLNIVELGLINVLFPEAKVMVALRDPRDVCLSCFFQDFRINAAMLHFTNLPRTVEFYRQVMELYLHLRGMLTLDCIEIRYEDTVRDLEKQARRITDLLGLDWDPSVLSFHERAAHRVISTPSFEAVTEPVHTRAIGRWHHYETQFGRLLDTLQPFVDSFGYA